MRDTSAVLFGFAMLLSGVMLGVVGERVTAAHRAPNCPFALAESTELTNRCLQEANRCLAILRTHVALEAFETDGGSERE